LSELINSNLGLLNKQLEKHGLSAGKIVCLDETPVKQDIQLFGNYSGVHNQMTDFFYCSRPLFGAEIQLKSPFFFQPPNNVIRKC